MKDRDGLADWLLSTEGRLVRIALGTVLILVGLALVGGFLGVLLLIIGAVPIASAAYGTLLIGPLLGRDIRGRRPEDQPREEPKDEGDGGDGDEATEDESEAETGGARRGEEPAEEPQEQLEKDTTGEPSATRDEGSGEGRRTSTADKGSGGDEEPGDAGSTGAPPLARAERPPGQGPRTKDPRAEGND